MDAKFRRTESHDMNRLTPNSSVLAASPRRRSKCRNRVGHNWRIPNIRGKRAVRHVVFDTNYWKSFVASRLLTPMGDRGSLSLWGRETERHMLFAEHLTAEYRVKTEGRGRKVDEWKMRPEAHDNHWFDGMVGCAVAASMCGCVLAGTDTAQARKPAKPKVKLSDIRRQKGHL